MASACCRRRNGGRWPPSTPSPGASTTSATATTSRRARCASSTPCAPTCALCAATRGRSPVIRCSPPSPTRRRASRSRSTPSTTSSTDANGTPPAPPTRRSTSSSTTAASSPDRSGGCRSACSGPPISPRRCRSPTTSELRCSSPTCCATSPRTGRWAACTCRRPTSPSSAAPPMPADRETRWPCSSASSAPAPDRGIAAASPSCLISTGAAGRARRRWPASTGGCSTASSVSPTVVLDRRVSLPVRQKVIVAAKAITLGQP